MLKIEPKKAVMKVVDMRTKESLVTRYFIKRVKAQNKLQLVYISQHVEKYIKGS